MSTPRPRTARRAAGRVVVVALAILLVAAIAGALWIGVRAVQAQAHLQEAQRVAADLPALVASDPSAAASVAESLSTETSAARDLTSDPAWRAAETLPWVGPQLSAVSVLASSIDDVVTDALGPVSYTHLTLPTNREV